MTVSGTKTAELPELLHSLQAQLAGLNRLRDGSNESDPTDNAPSEAEKKDLVAIAPSNDEVPKPEEMQKTIEQPELIRPSESEQKQIFEQNVKGLRSLFPQDFSFCILTTEQLVDLSYLKIFLAIFSTNSQISKEQEKAMVEIFNMLATKPWKRRNQQVREEHFKTIEKLFESICGKHFATYKPYLDNLKALQIFLSDTKRFHQRVVNKKLSAQASEQHFVHLIAYVRDSCKFVKPLINFKKMIESFEKNKGLAEEFQKIAVILKVIKLKLDNFCDKCLQVTFKTNSLKTVVDFQTLLSCRFEHENALTSKLLNIYDQLRNCTNKHERVQKRPEEVYQEEIFNICVKFYTFVNGSIDRFTAECQLAKETCSEATVVTLLKLFGEQLHLKIVTSEQEKQVVQKTISELQQQLKTDFLLTQTQIDKLTAIPEECFKMLESELKALRSHKTKSPENDAISKLLSQFASDAEKAIGQFGDKKMTIAGVLENVQLTFSAHIRSLSSKVLSRTKEQKAFSQLLRDAMKNMDVIEKKLGIQRRLTESDIEEPDGIEEGINEITNLAGTSHMLCQPAFVVIQNLITDTFGDWRQRIDLDIPISLEGQIFDDESLVKISTPAKKKHKHKLSKPKMKIVPNQAVPQQALTLSMHRVTAFPGHTQLLTKVMLNAASVHNVQITILPTMRLAKLQARAHLAHCDQLLALRLLAPTLEMVYHPRSYRDKTDPSTVHPALLSMTSLLMFLVAERGLTANIFKQDASRIVLHNLAMLGAKPENLLVKMLNAETITYRYSNAQKDPKLCLEAMPKLMDELVHLDQNSSTEVEALLKALPLKVEDFDVGGTLSSKEIECLQNCDKILLAAIAKVNSLKEQMEKAENSLAIEKLGYIAKHLEIVRAVPFFIQKFPHQRFLVVCAHMLFLSGQYGIETIGHWVAFQRGVDNLVDSYPGQVHALEELYCSVFNLDANLSEPQRSVLRALNVGKAFEYMNAYCSTHKTVTKPVEFFNELLKWSEAAGDFNSAWTPGSESEQKNASEKASQLCSELIRYCERISGLLAKLVEQHIIF